VTLDSEPEVPAGGEQWRPGIRANSESESAVFSRRILTSN
jgi:hypothetical protein